MKLFLFAGLCAACGACTADSPASVPTEAGEIISERADAKLSDPPSADSFRWEKLYTTQVEGLVLRATADIHAQEIATLPANALVIFGGERDGLESTIMTRKKSYQGDWLKVRQVDSKQDCWIFAGSYRGDSLIKACWSEESDPEATTLSIQAFSNWEKPRLSKAFGLQDFDTDVAQFSGFFHTNKSDDRAAQIKTGRFWAQGFGMVDGENLKVDISGKLDHGHLAGIITMRRIKDNAMETIWLKYNDKGQFEERWYEKELDGVVKTKYSDKVNSLNLNSIEMG